MQCGSAIKPTSHYIAWEYVDDQAFAVDGNGKLNYKGSIKEVNLYE